MGVVICFDDGGFGVVDFKTSAQNSEHIPLHARQLHAYACALEQAAPGRLALSPVRRLGLLVYEPQDFEQQTAGACRGPDAQLSYVLTIFGPSRALIPREDSAISILGAVEIRPSSSCGASKMFHFAWLSPVTSRATRKAMLSSSGFFHGSIL